MRETFRHVWKSGVPTVQRATVDYLAIVSFQRATASAIQYIQPPVILLTRPWVALDSPSSEPIPVDGAG